MTPGRYTTFGDSTSTLTFQFLTNDSKSQMKEISPVCSITPDSPSDKWLRKESLLCFSNSSAHLTSQSELQHESKSIPNLSATHITLKRAFSKVVGLCVAAFEVRSRHPTPRIFRRLIGTITCKTLLSDFRCCELVIEFWISTLPRRHPGACMGRQNLF
ncbi:hypothetical protein BDD12DRAFT_217640 [Trichophaea hybrida]|nr:hypothetical protein BDD12DRAFT_217640 [Trichophaea hybrida]